MNTLKVEQYTLSNRNVYYVFANIKPPFNPKGSKQVLGHWRSVVMPLHLCFYIVKYIEGLKSDYCISHKLCFSNMLAASK